MPTHSPSSAEEPESKIFNTGHRLVPLLVWAAIFVTFLVIPFKILSLGYLPFDDALRDAAKPIADRSWSEILELQDQFKRDHNPGWHWILGVVHHVTGAQADGLVMFAVFFLLLLFSLAPLAWMRRPESWVASLLVGMVFFPGMLLRYYLARPLVFSVVVTLTILLLWRKTPKPSARLLAVSAILFGLATWIHGSWYLFALVIAAFALAGQWRNSIALASCWLVGSFLGALLTGDPFGFLWNAVKIVTASVGQQLPSSMVVAEFQPNDGAPLVVLLAVVFLIARAVSGKPVWTAIQDPIFILFVLGWILGFRVTRFWEDWGLPAFSLWMALEIHDYLNARLAAESFRRLLITTGLCGAFFLCMTGDYRSRWTGQLDADYLDASNPELAGWMPENGGILYSSDMRVFYNTFFKNPRAPWKYILGFEPSFMPPDDLRIYRAIQANRYSISSHEPWVKKMRPQDRMVISMASPSPPALPALEWKHAGHETWIGRLPRQSNGQK